MGIIHGTTVRIIVSQTQKEAQNTPGDLKPQPPLPTSVNGRPFDSCCRVVQCACVRACPDLEPCCFVMCVVLVLSFFIFFIYMPWARDHKTVTGLYDFSILLGELITRTHLSTRKTFFLL